ncbi:MAG TPA: alpha-1,2-fucosyltransferase, partial [Kaistiaceae bacterium]|nr:alpha-1,2-fucosyltransferase [Kaistiaceae bacterium]
MIITRIYCGLGNQMFQYAVGRRLALERGVPLGLETTFYRTNSFRQYRLDHFRIAGRVLTDRELRVLEPPSGRWEKLARRIRRQRPYRSYFEHAFRFHPEVVDAPKNSYVAGYWQSEKYFDTVADTIRADFALVAPMTAPRAAIRDGMRGANAVSLHIRRGDYASDPEITAKHGLIPIPWYEDAVRFIKARVPDTVFYVFSDDPDWAEAHLKLSDPCV